VKGSKKHTHVIIIIIIIILIIPTPSGAEVKERVELYLCSPLDFQGLF
jgi:hypothetical protein